MQKASELNLGSLVQGGTVGLRNLKHGFLAETKHPGKEIGGEGLHGIVQFLGGGVEEAAGGSQLVLHISNLTLQLQEILVGLELGISLQRHLQTGEGTAQQVLGLDLVVDASSADGGGTCFGNLHHHLFVMDGIALDSGYQLGDEVVTLFELHIDVGKSILTVVTQFHQIVVDTYCPDSKNHDYNQQDNCTC